MQRQLSKPHNTFKRHASAEATRAGVKCSLITAVPAGTEWRLKAIGPDGTVALGTIFSNRLEALGAGVLVAERCGGRVLP